MEISFVYKIQIVWFGLTSYNDSTGLAIRWIDIMEQVLKPIYHYQRVSMIDCIHWLLKVDN